MRAIQCTDNQCPQHPTPPFDRIIQSPRNIRGSKDKHTGIVVTNAIHLNQKLRLDTSGALGLALVTSSGEGIDFVNEDDGWFVLSRHLEQLSHKSEMRMSPILVSKTGKQEYIPFRITLPLADQI
jgi:hypothetical protein